MAKVSLVEEETLKASVNDINYIPSYKIAEEERRRNELERISNENERIEYYEEVKRNVENGEFNGANGRNGDRGFSIFQTTGYISSPDDPIKLSINLSEVINPNNYNLMVGDLLISNNENSNGRIACITNINNMIISYSYFSEIKGEQGIPGTQGPQGEPGETPDMSGYVTSSITSIQVVSELPEVEEPNVLYLVEEE